VDGVNADGIGIGGSSVRVSGTHPSKLLSCGRLLGRMAGIIDATLPLAGQDSY